MQERKDKQPDGIMGAQVKIYRKKHANESRNKFFCVPWTWTRFGNSFNYNIVTVTQTCVTV
jgi:uncharacterized protein (DUF2235 family)